MKIGLEIAIGVLIIENYSWLKSLGCPIFFILITETRDFESNLLLYRFEDVEEVVLLIFRPVMCSITI